MTNRPVRLGVVGVGSLGFHHARLYSKLPGVTLAGVYDIDVSRASSAAGQTGTTAMPSLQALLDAVDAVSVVVPTPAHHEVGMAAIARGRHLLIEKPLAATIAEGEELVAAAGRAGVLLQTGHVERFNRAVRAALPHIRDVRFLESDRVAPFTVRGSDVAVILDLMIHDIDLVLALVRSPVTDVRASGIGVLTPSVDIATARLEFAGGAVANLTASRMARERVRKLRLFQPSGYLSLDLAAGTGEFLRLRPDAGAALLRGGVSDLAALVEQVPLSASEGEPLQLELESFVSAVGGEGPVVVSGADGLEALRIAYRVMEAMGPAAALAAV